MKPASEQTVPFVERRRRRDGIRVIAALALVFACLSILLSAWLYDRSVAARSQIAAEGEERRNQICLQDEREHLNAVEGLKLTYDYLAGLTPAQRREPLNALLLRELPRTEMEARVDQAPLFCDEPGVGLKEPDPELPERPQSLKP